MAELQPGRISTAVYYLPRKPSLGLPAYRDHFRYPGSLVYSGVVNCRVVIPKLRVAIWRGCMAQSKPHAVEGRPAPARQAQSPSAPTSFCKIRMTEPKELHPTVLLTTQPPNEAVPEAIQFVLSYLARNYSRDRRGAKSLRGGSWSQWVTDLPSIRMVEKQV